LKDRPSIGGESSFWQVGSQPPPSRGLVDALGKKKLLVEVSSEEVKIPMQVYGLEVKILVEVSSETAPHPARHEDHDTALWNLPKNIEFCVGSVRAWVPEELAPIGR
jgi:hypothetical protein